MNPNIRHKKLLENIRVQRWYDNLAVNSKLTADVYLRNLGLWLEWTDTNPDSIIEMARDHLEEFRGKIIDQIRKMERQGKHGSYIGVSLRPILSYLKLYDVVVRLGNINIKDENRNFTVEMERIPTNEELDSILQRANLKQRAIIGLIAFSGVRPGAIGNYTGNDGLKIGDIVDLKIESDGVKFEKLPALLTVRIELSKSHKKYHTFIGTQGAKYLKEYLNLRMQEGEKLTEDSALIKPDTNMSRAEIPNKFMESSFVEREVKKAIKKAGFKWRPYVFRHRFGVSLDASEGKGLISHSWRMHIMGHTGDIETTYSTGKPLPDSLINDMRKAFNKCLTYIETERKGMTEDEMEVKFRSELLIMAGFTEEEIAKNKLLDLNADEITKMARDKLFGIKKVDINAQIQQDREELSKTHKQKVILIDQVEEYINNGFTVKMALGNDRVIVEFS